MIEQDSKNERQRYGRCARDDRLGGPACNRRERSRRRSGCGYDGVRPGPRARGGRLELDDRALRYPDARHHPAQEARGAARQERYRQQDDDHPVRRQQQLVRRVGVLAAEDVRARGRPHDGRRTEEMAGRGPGAVDRQAQRRGEDVQGERAGPVAARVPAGSAAGVGGEEGRRSSTSAAPRSSPARSSRRPGFRKPASAAATFRARRAFPGARTATTTARSRASTS